jgi:hypothetical protein
MNILFDYTLFFRVQDIIRVWIKCLLTKLRFRDKQSCQYCGRDQHIIWSCSNKSWLKLSKKWHNKSLCLECFVALHSNLKLKDIKIIGFY